LLGSSDDFVESLDHLRQLVRRGKLQLHPDPLYGQRADLTDLDPRALWQLPRLQRKGQWETRPLEIAIFDIAIEETLSGITMRYAMGKVKQREEERSRRR
jgi:hypothetical protein